MFNFERDINSELSKIDNVIIGDPKFPLIYGWDHEDTKVIGEIFVENKIVKEYNISKVETNHHPTHQSVKMPVISDVHLSNMHGGISGIVLKEDDGKILEFKLLGVHLTPYKSRPETFEIPN